MADKELSWKFAEDFIVERAEIAQARLHSIELGIDAVSPAMGAQLAVIAAATAATNIIEIGTGVGVSGLWLLSGAPDATLTSIDFELDHQQSAKMRSSKRVSRRTGFGSSRDVPSTCCPG